MTKLTDNKPGKEKNRVLIVDDERSNIIALTKILSPEYEVLAETDGRDAIETAKKHSPDVILLDIIMEDIDGYEVLTRLKSDEDTANIPVIFVTGLVNNEDEEKGLSLGAADYITKPFSSAIVKLRLRNLFIMLNQIETIKHLSETDQLTNLPNRRNFDNRLNLMWEYAKREKRDLSILIIDIDNFKEYNDTYGHLQGDLVLTEVARAIEASIKRSVDAVARWGGEEFIVLLPDTDAAGAYDIAEKIRVNVENTPIPCEGGNFGSGASSVTVSIGANTLSPAPESVIRKFILDADKALYTAKRTGKNKTCHVK